MADNLPALKDLDIGMASETDILASQIATELDLGLAPKLPAVAGESPARKLTSTVAGVPAAAASVIERSNALANSIMDKLQTSMNVGNRTAKAYADAIVESVDANQTIALVEDTAEMQAENKTLEIFQAAGGYEGQLDRAKDAREFEIKLEALHEKRADILDDEHTGIGIIDDAINNFRVAKTTRALNVTAEQARRNLKDIENATIITESASKANILVKQTANEGTIAANQKLIAAEGAAKLHEATLVQNRSNADALQSMLAASGKVLSNTMLGFQLAESVEARKLRMEMHQLALRQDTRNQVKDEIAIRRSLLSERREIIETKIKEKTATASEQALLTSFKREEVALDQAELGLAESLATSDDRVAGAKLARASAETALDIANLQYNNLDFDSTDPEVIEATKAARDLAIINRDKARIELLEFQDEAGIRRAAREGNLDAITIQNKIATLQLESAELLAAGKNADALAKLAEADKLRVDKELVRSINVQDIRSFQSKLLGKAGMEDPAVISSRLDQKDPLYEMMRQREATAPLVDPTDPTRKKLVLGTTPAKAMAFLNQLEAAGFTGISNDITGVRILREVSAILAAEDADNPNAAAQLTEAGLAARFNAKAQEHMNEKEGGIQWNDVTNFLKPLTIPQMVELGGKDPNGLAAQPLFSKVLIPDGNVDPNPDTIFSKGVVALNANVISQDELVDGVVAWGHSIAIYNNVSHHGMESVGLPNQTQVNMTVMRPRGKFGSLIDSIQSDSRNKIVFPAAAGIITAASLAAAPVTLGASVPLGAATIGTLSTGVALTTAAGLLKSSSDFMTLNIADPVAVKQYLIAILSSTTLGGENTATALNTSGVE